MKDPEIHLSQYMESSGTVRNDEGSLHIVHDNLSATDVPAYQTLTDLRQFRPFCFFKHK